MNSNHHKLFGLFVLTLMLSGIVPLAQIPTTSGAPEAQHTLSEFTWQTFNKNMNVTTFVSPDGSRDELWHFLNSAEESIYVEIYGVNNPYILDLIHELHATKPTLEMKFLIGWNSLGYYSPNDYVANNLTLLGYPVKWTNDTDFTYAHQKFVIIDNETTIVHAGNWAKTSFPEDGNKANREWSIAMTDTEVTGYYRSVFDYDWGRGIDYDAGTHGTGSPLTYTQTSSTYARPFATSGEFSGPMNVTPIFSPDTSLEAILYCINAAQVTLDIQIPYFTSVGDAGAVDQVIAAIIAAKDRGVTVRVITEEGSKPDVEIVAEDFHEHGIPVVYQDERWFSAQHNKGIIVDGRMVLISSINYSDGSISENREAGVIIENEEIAQWYLDVYDFDWSIGDAGNSDELNLYWEPNIPTSSAAIKVTVYAHMLRGDVDEVRLEVKIGTGAAVNNTITANVEASAEGDDENYFYNIPAQPDGTDIVVQGHLLNGSTWHHTLELVIQVRDSVGPVPTTTTTPTTPTTPTTSPTTPPPPPPDGIAALLAEYGIYIIAAVAALILAIVFKRR